LKKSSRFTHLEVEERSDEEEGEEEREEDEEGGSEEEDSEDKDNLKPGWARKKGKKFAITRLMWLNDDALDLVANPDQPVPPGADDSDSEVTYINETHAKYLVEWFGNENIPPVIWKNPIFMRQVSVSSALKSGILKYLGDSSRLV
jgi:hypothetical protein